MAPLISSVQNSVLLLKSIFKKEEIESLCIHKTSKHGEVLPTHMSAVCAPCHIAII